MEWNVFMYYGGVFFFYSLDIWEVKLYRMVSYLCIIKINILRIRILRFV